LTALVGVPLLFAVPALSASLGQAPVVAETTIVAAPHPYDEGADADAVVAAAQQQAQAAGKRLMVVFGANWCPDCRALAGVLQMGDVRGWTDQHYVIVEVDVGRFDKNLDLAARFDRDLKHSGIPTVAIVSQNGGVLNTTDARILSDARSMTPQSIVDVLARWTQIPSS
jgi:thiol-disulfide isomerase/thioredoxin